MTNPKQNIKFFSAVIRLLSQHHPKQLNKLNRTPLITNKFSCIKCISLSEDPCINLSLCCKSTIWWYIYSRHRVLYHKLKRPTSWGVHSGTRKQKRKSPHQRGIMNKIKLIQHKRIFYIINKTCYINKTSSAGTQQPPGRTSITPKATLDKEGTDVSPITINASSQLRSKQKCNWGRQL